MADWDIYRQPLPPPETIKKHYTEIKSEPSVLSSGFRQVITGPINMRTRQLDDYYNLNDAYINVKFRIIKGDNTTAADTDYVTMINAGWHLFDRAELRINGDLIESVQNCGKVHLYSAMIQDSPASEEEVSGLEWIYREDLQERVSGHLQASVDYQNRYTALGYAQHVDYDRFVGVSGVIANGQDQVDAGDQLIMPKKDAQLKYNESWLKRFSRSQGSQTVELHLPLRAIFGFCNQYKKPIHGAGIHIQLTRNTDYAHILHANYALGLSEYKTIIDSCSLWLPICEARKEVLLELERELMDSTAQYDFIARTCYVSQEYPSNTTKLDWDLHTTAINERPVLMVVGFMNEAQRLSQADLVASNVGRVPSVGDIAFATHLATADTAANRIGPRVQNLVANGGLTSHLNDINRCTVRINDKPFPQLEYNQSFADETTIRAYNDFLSVCLKNRPESSKMLDYATWKESPLFAYQFDQQLPSSGSDSYVIRLEALTRSGDQATNNAGSFQIYCVLYTLKTVLVRANNGMMTYTLL